MDKMQESIRLILSIKRAISSIEPSEDLQYMCEPLLPLVDKFLKDNNEPIPLHLVFGYEMLLSSYKAFMWLNQTINNQNYRILVLGLAVEVHRSIKAALNQKLECDCSSRNEQFHRLLLEVASWRLDDFIREKRFDLYHQARGLLAATWLKS
jgi:hypothetical protein